MSDKQTPAGAPTPWEQLPDLALYMDQLIFYMGRQLPAPGGEGGLTASMVHNYMKAGVLPRADGKRYTRQHIAYLTAICVLKQVLSVKDTAALLHQNLPDGEIEPLYRELSGLLARETAEARALLPPEAEGGADTEALAAAALHLAVSAYARQLACRLALDELAARTASETPAEAPEKRGKHKA